MHLLGISAHIIVPKDFQSDEMLLLFIISFLALNFRKCTKEMSKFRIYKFTTLTCVHITANVQFRDEHII